MSYQTAETDVVAVKLRVLAIEHTVRNQWEYCLCLRFLCCGSLLSLLWPFVCLHLQGWAPTLPCDLHPATVQTHCQREMYIPRHSLIGNLVTKVVTTTPAAKYSRSTSNAINCLLYALHSRSLHLYYHVLFLSTFSIRIQNHTIVVVFSRIRLVPPPYDS